MSIQICVVDGCDNGASAKKMCPLHYRRARTGVPLTQPLGQRNYDQGSYGMTHKRITYKYGKAAKQLCVNCGKQALDWSYNHSGIEERVLIKSSGEGREYSSDIDQYVPRCRKCHRLFDREHNRNIR
jgi:hypothetical protein